MYKRYEAMKRLPVPYMCELSMMYGRPVLKLSSGGTSGKYLIIAMFPILFGVVIYLMFPNRSSDQPFAIVLFCCFAAVIALISGLMIWSAIWCKQSVWISFDSSYIEISRGFFKPGKGKKIQLDKAQVEATCLGSNSATYPVQLGELERIVPKIEAVDRETLVKTAKERCNNLAALAKIWELRKDDESTDAVIERLSDEELYWFVNAYRGSYCKTECVAMMGSEHDYRDLSDYLTKLIEMMLDDRLAESYDDELSASCDDEEA